MPYRLIARSTDVGFITPKDAVDAASIVGEIGAEHLASGRNHDPVRVFADLVVILDSSEQAARERQERLDQTAGTPCTSDA